VIFQPSDVQHLWKEKIGLSFRTFNKNLNPVIFLHSCLNEDQRACFRNPSEWFDRSRALRFASQVAGAPLPSQVALASPAPAMQLVPDLQLVSLTTQGEAAPQPTTVAPPASPLLEPVTQDEAVSAPNTQLNLPSIFEFDFDHNQQCPPLHSYDTAEGDVSQQAPTPLTPGEKAILPPRRFEPCVLVREAREQTQRSVFLEANEDQSSVRLWIAIHPRTTPYCKLEGGVVVVTFVEEPIPCATPLWSALASYKLSLSMLGVRDLSLVKVTTDSQYAYISVGKH